jgi:hypothetical protein
MKKISYAVFSIVAIITMIFGGASDCVYASQSDLSVDDLRLRIACEYEGDPVSEQQFYVYKVADISATGAITVTNAFKNYQVDYSRLKDEDQWQTLAEVLRVYALRDQLKSDCNGKTDERGEVEFTKEDGEIEKGIYLVVQRPLKVDGDVYTIKPFLVKLPEEEEKGEPQYDVVVIPKEKFDMIPDTVDVNVIKIWDDENAKSYRPDSIEIQLLKDGKIYQTKKLSEKNNWRYTWKELDGDAEWLVVEKDVPDNYTVVSYSEDNEHTITNSVDPSLRDPENSDKTTKTNTPSQSVSTKNSSSGRLPQTGQLWWPVPVMLLIGLCLVNTGLLVGRKKEKKDEK